MNRIGWVIAALGLTANGFFGIDLRELWGKDPGMGGVVVAYLLFLALAGSLLFLVLGGAFSHFSKNRSLKAFLRHPSTLTVMLNMALNGIFVYGYLVLGMPKK